MESFSHSRSLSFVPNRPEPVTSDQSHQAVEPERERPMTEATAAVVAETAAVASAAAMPTLERRRGGGAPIGTCEGDPNESPRTECPMEAARLPNESRAESCPADPWPDRPDIERDTSRETSRELSPEHEPPLETPEIRGLSSENEAALER